MAIVEHGTFQIVITDTIGIPVMGKGNTGAPFDISQSVDRGNDKRH